MRQLAIPRMAISLTLAVLAACALIGINEVGNWRSNEALDNVTEAQRMGEAVNKLLQQMLDAETGQRGYLLTGDALYLEPYQASIAEIGQTTQALRRLYLPFADQAQTLATLNSNVERKLGEMELSVSMRKQGNEDAWKFVLTTDVGKNYMQAIRENSNKLIESNQQRLLRGQTQIVRALQFSRIGIAIMGLLSLLAFYMYLLQTTRLNLADRREQESLKRERDQLERQVRERTASLAELATHLQQVREEERGHLARELHDELGALLTAAKLDVARLKSRVGSDSPEALQRLQHLTQTLNSGIALKRRIIEDLRPSSLSNLGLVASLEILAREFGEQSGLQIVTDLEDVELGGSSQLTIYRLVQESLTNIGKYARARQVQIALHNFETHVIVEVRDDGAGFDLAHVRPSGHGLAGMRHRVEAGGGRLTVSSTPGTGTRISAVLPTSAYQGADTAADSAARPAPDAT
ncbi:MAG: CHASE3 domain-containing protein [Burkholderiaceae bacterium]|nr:CHASE3 domain-containing protein [Burkholderiaceae bacterium]MDO9088881.1 CHASE3 domain-containing protein [Burkholderiaceae bacterium]